MKRTGRAVSTCHPIFDVFLVIHSTIRTPHLTSAIDVSAHVLQIVIVLSSLLLCMIDE